MKEKKRTQDFGYDDESFQILIVYYHCVNYTYVFHEPYNVLEIGITNSTLYFNLIRKFFKPKS